MFLGCLLLIALCLNQAQAQRTISNINKPYLIGKDHSVEQLQRNIIEWQNYLDKVKAVPEPKYPNYDHARTTALGSTARSIDTYNRLYDYEVKQYKKYKEEHSQAVRDAKYIAKKEIERLEKLIKEVKAKEHVEILLKQYDNAYDAQGELFAVKQKNKWGYVDKTGAVKTPLIYEDLSGKSLDFGLREAKLNGKWAYLDNMGKVLTPFKYDSLAGFRTYQLFEYAYTTTVKNKNTALFSEVQIDGKKGYVDRLGREVVPPLYDKIEFWDSVYAKVYIGQKAGLVNYRQGKEILPPQYETVSSFRDGFATIVSGGQRGVVSAAGLKIMPFKYDKILAFSKDEYLVVQNNKKGLIYADGTEMTPPKYDHIELVKIRDVGDYIKVWIGEKCGYLAISGKEILPIQYDVLGHPNQHAIVKAKLQGKWGYINLYGKEIIPIQYDKIEAFSNNEFLKVTINGKLGLLDNRGKEIVPAEYENLRDLHAGNIGLKRNGEWSIADKQTGKEIAAGSYEDIASYFQEDFLAAKQNGKWGFIDKTGKVTIPFMYDYPASFFLGVAVVRLGKESFTINKKGERLTKARK